MTGPTHALSLHQPWASLIALAVKRIETRSWAAPEWLIGERIAIHAAKRLPGHCSEVGLWSIANQADGVSRMTDGQRWVELPLGAAVAAARLDACLPMVTADECGTDMHAPPHICQSGDRRLQIHRPLRAPFDDGSTEQDFSHELPYGDFSPGRFGWLLADIVPVEPAVPCRGRQRVWRLPEDVAERIGGAA